MNEFIPEKYENILRKDPGALDSVYEVAGDNDMSDADRLYLCTFAPVLYRFTGWILDAAKKSGTERLYFCARDAYPIFKAAEVIRDRGITVPELKYLELSRFSVREPLYGMITKEECLDQLFLRGIDITVERVLRRAGFSTDELLMILEDIDFRESLAEPLSTRDLGDLRERVEASRLFWELLNLRSEAISREPDQSFNEDYCKWCYTDGDFIYKQKDSLIDFLLQNMPNPQNQSDDERRQFYDTMLSQLKHWKA